MMRIAIITAFPSLIRAYITESIIGRAVDAGLIDISVIDIRDHADGERRRIDDYAYGSGGMVLMAEPLKRAVESAAPREHRYVVSTTPQGIPLHQELVEDLRRVLNDRTLIIVCGHYEGMDERFTEECVDIEVSLGDFVLTGGELPALAIADSTARLVSGVVGRSEAVKDDSFYSGMLDHPHYTRPAIWEGRGVPDELIEGHEAKTTRFRRSEAAKRTISRRPDLLSRAAAMPYMAKGVYAVELHHPVLDRNGNKSSTAVTGLDVHDISRACRTYGIKKYIIVSPMAPQREMVKKIVSHWIDGHGASFNRDRKEAMELVKTFASYRRALEWIGEREDAEPYVIATSAREDERAENWLTLKSRLLTLQRPAVFLFGTGHGLHSDVIDSANSVLAPIKGSAGYNHLSVRSAAAIVFDRFFGFR